MDNKDIVLALLPQESQGNRTMKTVAVLLIDVLRNGQGKATYLDTIIQKVSLMNVRLKILDNNYSQDAIGTCIDCLSDCGVLQSWLVLRSEANKQYYRESCIIISVFSIGSYESLMAKIHLLSCLPLPMVTDKGEYLFLHSQILNTPIEKLNSRIFYDDESRQVLINIDIGIQMNGEYMSVGLPLTYKITVQHFSLGEYAFENKEVLIKHIMYRHLLWGFLQAWVRNEHSGYRRNQLNLKDVANSLILLRASKHEAKFLSDRGVYLIAKITHGYEFNLYLTYSPKRLHPQGEMTFCFKAFETPSVATDNIIQYYRQMMYIHKMGGAIESFLKFIRYPNVGPGFLQESITKTHNSRILMCSSVPGHGELVDVDVILSERLTQEVLRKRQMNLPPQSNLAEALSMDHPNLVIVNTTSLAPSAAGIAEPTVKPLLKTRTVEQINALVQERKAEMTDVPEADPIQTMVQQMQAAGQTLQVLPFVRKCLDECYKMSLPQQRMRSMRFMILEKSKCFKEAVTCAGKNGGFSEFLIDVYKKLQQWFTPAIARRIMEENIYMHLRTKYLACEETEKSTPVDDYMPGLISVTEYREQLSRSESQVKEIPEGRKHHDLQKCVVRLDRSDIPRYWKKYLKKLKGNNALKLMGMKPDENPTSIEISIKKEVLPEESKDYWLELEKDAAKIEANLLSDEELGDIIQTRVIDALIVSKNKRIDTKPTPIFPEAGPSKESQYPAESKATFAIKVSKPSEGIVKKCRVGVVRLESLVKKSVWLGALKTKRLNVNDLSQPNVKRRKLNRDAKLKAIKLEPEEEKPSDQQRKDSVQNPEKAVKTRVVHCFQKNENLTAVDTPMIKPRVVQNVPNYDHAGAVDTSMIKPRDVHNVPNDDHAGAVDTSMIKPRVVQNVPNYDHSGAVDTPMVKPRVVQNVPNDDHSGAVDTPMVKPRVVQNVPNDDHSGAVDTSMVKPRVVQNVPNDDHSGAVDTPMVKPRVLQFDPSKEYIKAVEASVVKPQTSQIVTKNDSVVIPRLIPIAPRNNLFIETHTKFLQAVKKPEASIKPTVKVPAVDDKNNEDKSSLHDCLELVNGRILLKKGFGVRNGVICKVDEVKASEGTEQVYQNIPVVEPPSQGGGPVVDPTSQMMQLVKWHTGGPEVTTIILSAVPYTTNTPYFPFLRDAQEPIPTGSHNWTPQFINYGSVQGMIPQTQPELPAQVATTVLTQNTGVPSQPIQEVPVTLKPRECLQMVRDPTSMKEVQEQQISQPVAECSQGVQTRVLPEMVTQRPDDDYYDLAADDFASPTKEPNQKRPKSPNEIVIDDDEEDDIEIVHCGIVKTSYRCKKCPKIFAAAHFLEFHVKLKHDRDMYCVYCEVTLPDHQRLESHLQSGKHLQNKRRHEANPVV